MNGACVYVDGGKGHYIPAVAVKKELEKLGNTIYLEELFDFMHIKWLGKINKTFWRMMLRNSKLENKISKMNDSSNGMDLAIKFGHRFCTKRLLKYIKDNKINFFFTTHPYAGTVISEILAKQKINVPVYYFATDVFSAPIASICNNLRRFYISTEEGRDIVIKMGMQEDKVILSPFPIQDCLANNRLLSKEEARKKLNLSANTFTIQFNLGGEGLGSLEILKELKNCEKNIQIIVVGGINKEMKQKISALSKILPSNIKIICVGFIKEVDLYLAASDIIVGRSGINTLLEAFYAHRPFLITELVYTVMSSADYVEKYKLGWNCNRNPEKQLEIIKRLIKDPSILDEMDKNFDALPIEFSAKKLAEMVLQDVTNQEK